MIRGILFDMDGIILNTERLSRVEYFGACEEFGYPQMNDEIYERLIGRPRVEDCRIMKAEFGEDFPFDEMYDRYRERLVKRVLSGIDCTKPGLKECMEGLKARGMKIALATSTGREVVKEYIAHIPLMQNVFDDMVCGVEAGRGKPAPDIYLEAARRIGCRPEECIGVEDSQAGLQSLTAAGCVRVMIPDILPCDERFDGLVDHELQTLCQIPRLVDRLNLEARARS